MRLVVHALLAFAILALPACGLEMEEMGGTTTLTGVVEEDVYVAGGTVRILAEVEGDVVAAGFSVLVDRVVTEDVIVAGGMVSIAAEVHDDLRAAGGEVSVHDRVDGDAVIAGGRILILRTARIGERAWLLGEQVEVGGHVGQELRVRAGRVVLTGQVDGDVMMTAREIEIGPDARIAGRLAYRSPQEAVISPEAQIDGPITYEAIAEAPEVPVDTALLRILPLLGIFVLGIAWIGFFPRFSLGAARVVQEKPLHSLGLGLLVLIVTPIAAGLVMASVIGMPLGISVLLAYAIFLPLGFLTGALFLGDLFQRLMGKGGTVSKGWRMLFLLLALAVIGVIQFIPFLGALLVLLLFLVGVGALAIHSYRAYHTPPAKLLA